MRKLMLLERMNEFREVATRMDPASYMLAIFISLLAAVAASFLYRVFYESRGTGSQVNRAFPLLGLSITTLFIGVQVSLPLSLGLLGALSIIRFRTPIKEPEEVGFIMLVIAASVSCATFNFHFLFILYLLATLTLLFTRSFTLANGRRRDGVLVLNLPDEQAAEQHARLQEALGRRVRRCSLESSSSRNGQTSLQFSFTGLKDVCALQAELRGIADRSAVNVFLDRPGGLR